MYQYCLIEKESPLFRVMSACPLIVCSGFHCLLIDSAVHSNFSRPRWLSWMHPPTGDQEVSGSTPTEVGNILSWRLIMKYFLRSFSPFC